MAAPTKEAQEAEANARRMAGIDPAENAAAMDVIDDVGDNGGPAPQPRSAPEPGERTAPQPIARSPHDQKRMDIISRFKTNRTEEADDARDHISDFARSGMPPEFEPPAPEPVAEELPDPAAAVVEQPEPAARPTMVKVKINGVEREVPLDEALGKAQIAYASEDILGEVKALKKELLERTHNPQRSGAPGHHAEPQRAQPADPQNPEPEDGVDPNTTDNDPFAKVIEAMQFGDPTEARTLLQNTIAAEVGNQVTSKLQNERLKDEGARTQNVLSNFLKDHPDLAQDSRARAVIEWNVYEGQLADIRALGVDPDTLQTPHGGKPTPGDIAMAHKFYRSEGLKVRKADELLETATKDYLDWRGVKTPEPPADPGRAAPRVEVTVDRTARRAAIPQQPSRTVAPKPAAEQQPQQPRDRSSIVEQMKLRTKGSPRRGGANVPAT